MTPGQRIHIIGIGGFGMSAIARILLGQGYRVSGSDRRANRFTASLQEAGAQVHIGHDAAHIQGMDLVVATSAVPEVHVEIAAARARGIPVYRRSEFIAHLMHDKTVIAAAGTHGKTTTTAMIAHILLTADHQPSYIVGGVMQNTGTNAGVGAGPVFVIEADEYDNMFLGLQPDVAIITSTEWDHPDFFTSPQAMMEAFHHFAGRVPEDGVLILHEAVADQLEAPQARAVTYGFGDACLWRATNIRYGPQHTLFDVLRQGRLVGTVALGVPGDHNVLNALAALIAAGTQAVPFSTVARALATFQGTGRRFDLRADVDGVAVIDDYAHHPTAIRTTLDAARKRYPERAVWAVWQPHTYSRTKQLQADYLRAFTDADHVIITDIYAAREQPDPTIHSAQLARAVHHPHVMHAASLADAVTILAEQVQAPAVILILSAGDAPQIGVDYLAQRGGGS